MKARHAVALLAGCLLSLSAASADLAKGLAAVEARDWATALKQFEPLAGRGDAAAQVNLGNLYLRGLGVDQDYAQALKWYARAAGRNHPAALGKLGLMHYYGLGVEVNRVEAARWFLGAADLGEGSAALILGEMYAGGDGVGPDRVQAYVWYSIAAESGKPEARDRREQAADELSPAELNDALTRLTVWRSGHDRLPPDVAAERSPAEPPTARGREGGDMRGKPPRPARAADPG